MVSALRALILVLCVLVFAAPVCAQAIANWAAPATWSPHSASRGASTMALITSPVPFIGLRPCRIADTRGNGFTGAYGPPSLSQGSLRIFTLTGQCDIPSSAAAVSLNVTVTNTQGPGFILIYPQQGFQPTVSTLNYVANETIANAAIVPLGIGGGITVVAGVSGTDLILDTNGFYASGVGTHNTFLGPNAGNFTMTGDGNTGIGSTALFSNTDGDNNTACGAFALRLNNTGDDNTATGHGALANSTAGSQNTAIGSGALHSDVLGGSNTAIGVDALSSTTGSSNIGIGRLGGAGLTTGSGNICIGNEGVAGESSTIRIGSNQTATFVAGVSGFMTGGTGTPVLIDVNGQLGTISSSVRFKDEIQDMGEATERLLKLRPVTFRYKTQPEGRTQFGLIAEEVEKVMPELVVCSSSGEAETILYHEMPAMLLNELQKQQREIQELKLELSTLRAVIGQR